MASSHPGNGCTVLDTKDTGAVVVVVGTDEMRDRAAEEKNTDLGNTSDSSTNDNDDSSTNSSRGSSKGKGGGTIVPDETDDITDILDKGLLKGPGEVFCSAVLMCSIINVRSKLPNVEVGESKVVKNTARTCKHKSKCNCCTKIDEIITLTWKFACKHES